ncbi:MAG TPA: DUF3048 domain-containing protein [Nocardioidaceae bacterium]|nr:DUF3048 domain-containing protein [Nocardioidaceae bacterium]
MSGFPMRFSAPTRRPGPRTLVALTLTASLALAGCSGDSKDSPEAEDTPQGQSTANGATLSGQWPLTGLPAEGDAPKHPVMVVKIDNTTSSDPQIGLSKADLITEELVEGGSTRLAVFYYSQVPKKVGPVRSFRASDIGIVKPAEAVLVASGGAGPTVRRVHAAHIKTVTEGGTGYYRDNGRPAPYNLFMDLPKLAKTLKSPAPPENYLPWGSEDDLPQGQPAKGLAAQFSGGHTTTWKYQGGTYANLNSHAAQGDQFKPDTVLVLRVRVGDAGYKDPAGNPVPETKFTGKGDAMLFHGGQLVRGTWSKKSLKAPVELRTKAGELTVPPGNVWMELVPAKGGNVTVTK